jgi:hypothetical protein
MRINDRVCANRQLVRKDVLFRNLQLVHNACQVFAEEQDIQRLQLVVYAMQRMPDWD